MEQNLTRIFTLFGGLALFLYGMDALSHSLETAAGSRLKSLLAAAPEKARLTPDLLELVHFLKDRYFCTWACGRGLRSRRCCKAARQSR